jgi:HAE1 family hydrophobic/amphiphilic exporter-1
MPTSRYKILVLLLGLPLLFFFGCTLVGPDFHQPPGPVAPAWQESADPRVLKQAHDFRERLADRSLPQGAGYDWTATSYQERQVDHKAYFIYALSITLVFLVLAALYESWASPAAVILAVPLAMVGVLLALILRGFDNNLYTQIGLVLMIALASKNAILIVEFARDLKRQGLAAIEAAIEATGRRFRPMVMTSLAFILGVVPLVVTGGAGAASQQAIGTAVFGGHDRLHPAGHSLCPRVRGGCFCISDD